MLDNRDYMRADNSGDPFWRRLPVYVLLIMTLVAVFAFQEINLAYFHSGFWQYLVLSETGLKHGYVWQLLTFQFLHANFMHLLGNVIGLWCFAGAVETVLGKAGFLKLYLLSGVAGGLLNWILMALFPMHFGGSVVGASAGIFGVIAAFAMIDPEATILLNFFIPIRAKYLLYIEGGIALFYTLLPSAGIAHAAHLGGMLFGVAYMKWDLNSWGSDFNWNFFRRKPRQRPRGSAPIPEGILAKLKRGSEPRGDAPPAQEFISSEVDPILDKISAHGIQSLTEKERKILQSARAKISKR
jgi:membrane associated rhomboid family serine protease